MPKNKKPAPIVALDSNVIVWGVRDAGAKRLPIADRKKTERCKWLLWDLKDRQATIVVPAIVASEVLRGVAPKKHLRFMDQLRKLFVIAPFDLKASIIAGQLWHARLKKIPDHPDPNVKIKADLLIVASAKAANAGAFYSNDEGARKIARLAMDSYDLPTAPPTLFEI